MTSESPMNTPNMDSKSWFQRWNFRQENIMDIDNVISENLVTFDNIKELQGMKSCRMVLHSYLVNFCRVIDSLFLFIDCNIKISEK